jgi:xyloglucan:xyloglucosyl transferase
LHLPDCLCSAAGSGFASRAAHLHGLFSASIKLPADHTAGVVVAFYVSAG